MTTKRPGRFVVGLTGGIGTGKSSALVEFARLGAATMSLDRLAHEMARPGRAGFRAVLRAFGRGVLRPGGAIDRRALGALVFGDARARARLERATHPCILRAMERRMKRLRGIVIVDVPLLFEKGLERRFDATILVSCRPAQQLRRVMLRDSLTAAEAARRLRAQWPLRRKRGLADVTIDNDKTVRALRARVHEYHEGLQLLYGGTPHGH